MDLYDYDQVIAKRETAVRPSGPESVGWWLQLATLPAPLAESTASKDLYRSYRVTVQGELGEPLGLHAWSAVMTHLGYPAATARRASRPGARGACVRVRKGARLP